MQKMYWRQTINISDQKDGLTDEERPMENDALLINTSDVEIGNDVRGTEDAKNTVPNTREENSKGISNINQPTNSWY